jgi:hypothetical protein
MQGLGDAMVEMEYRTKRFEAELEHDRLAYLAAAARSRDGIGSQSRRMVVRLGDLLVGLGCQLQARYAAEPGTVAC